MVSKKKEHASKGRVKVNKLKLNKETVQDLSGDEANRIKGGGLKGCGTDTDLNAAVKVNAVSAVCADTT